MTALRAKHEISSLGAPMQASQRAETGDGVRPDRAPPLPSHVRGVLLLSLATASTQVLGVVTQSARSALFGAGVEMDAFFAASAAPTYVASVVSGPIATAIALRCVAQGAASEAAEREGATLVGAATLAVAMLAVVGTLASDLVLRASAPGLAEAVRGEALVVASIVWASVAIGAAQTALLAVHQARSSFVIPAIASIAGSVATLAVLLLTGRGMGWPAMAWSLVAGATIGTASLLFRARLRRPDRVAASLKAALALAVPLVLGNALARSPLIVERRLGSTLPEGTLSHLALASGLAGQMAAVLSTGIATVLLPQLAATFLARDPSAVRSQLVRAERRLWLVVAPAVFVGLALASPLVGVLLERGRFTATDTAAVAALLRVYLFALPAMCLGALTGQCLYAMRRVRLVAIVGAVESVIYVLCTPLLADRWGATGVALGFVFYFSASLLWAALVIAHDTGGLPSLRSAAPFAQTGCAAALGGAAAWVASAPLSGAWPRLIAGGVAGLAAYVAALLALGSTDARDLWRELRPRWRASASSPTAR